MYKIITALVFAVAALFITRGLLVHKTPLSESFPEFTEKSAPVNEASRVSSSEDNRDVTTVASSTKVSPTKTLDLSGQGLVKTPTYVFNRSDIQELNLSNNRLDGSLQAEVRNLQNLQVLNLSNNQFTGLPAEVGQLANLQILDLSNNHLTGLPYELGNLQKLKVLNLKGNKYSALDLNIIKAKLPASTIIQVD